VPHADLDLEIPPLVTARQTPAPNVAGLDHGADLLGLTVEMIRFITRNPGCAQVSGTRERYTDGFRQFVLELGWRYSDVTIAEFAAAIDLPLDTVEDWLRGGRRDVDTSTAPRTNEPCVAPARARLA
jgi:hypothetical protein